MDVSIIIRTYNEARWLPDVLAALQRQSLAGLEVETVLVDSGSTDGTVAIAREAGARIVRIDKHEFTFGRSLNRGCDAARGSVLVFLSGHCIPVADDWLVSLVEPVSSGQVVYSYGRQTGRAGVTKFSEEMLFRKYFPARPAIPQDGYFCNNANAALDRETWSRRPFDEEVTGLEDLDLAKALVADGHAVGYVSAAAVLHLHEENWHQVRLRYEREAIALRKIMPEVELQLLDVLRYAGAGILLDTREALRMGGTAWREKGLLRLIPEIVFFRVAQYWGAWRGANYHRRLTRERKEEYFYPR